MGRAIRYRICLGTARVCIAEHGQFALLERCESRFRAGEGAPFPFIAPQHVDNPHSLLCALKWRRNLGVFCAKCKKSI